MMRRVLTIPFTDDGPKELEKLLAYLQSGLQCDFEGAPYWAVEPDGVVLLCIPVAMASMPEGEEGE